MILNEFPKSKTYVNRFLSSSKCFLIASDEIYAILADFIEPLHHLAAKSAPKKVFFEPIFGSLVGNIVREFLLRRTKFGWREKIKIMEIQHTCPRVFASVWKGSVCWRNQVSFIDCSVFPLCAFVAIEKIKHTFLHIKEIKRKMRNSKELANTLRLQKKSSSWREKKPFYFRAKTRIKF